MPRSVHTAAEAAPWVTLWRAHISQRKELAFARWQRSRYTDMIAWTEFIQAFTILANHTTNLKASQRNGERITKT